MTVTRSRYHWHVLLLGLVLALLTGAADYVTGYQTSVLLFYLFPVVLVNWYAGRTYGILIAFFCAAESYTVGRMSGLYLYAYTAYWNVAMVSGVLMLVSILTSIIKSMNAGLEEKVKDKTKILVQEIAERKKVEGALRMHRERLEYLVEERTVKLKAEIVERERAEEKVRLYQKELLAAIFEKTKDEEKEKRVLSEVLHDNIGQNLFLATLKLESLRESGAGVDVSRRANEIQAMINEAIRFARTLTTELRPTILYELGFVAAIENLTEEIQARFSITARVDADGDFSRVSVEKSALIYKTLRELLVNVIKHANARNVGISLRSAENVVWIDVSDDGVGIDTLRIDSAESMDGFGLFLIRERVKYMGGVFEMTSIDSGGTKATISVPLDEPASEAP